MKVKLNPYTITRNVLYAVLVAVWLVVFAQIADYWLSLSVFNFSSVVMTALLHLAINGLFGALFYIISQIKE